MGCRLGGGAVCRNWPSSAQNMSKSARTRCWSNWSRIQAHLARIRPTSAKFGPTSVECDRESAKFGRFRPTSARAEQNTACVQTLVMALVPQRSLRIVASRIAATCRASAAGAPGRGGQVGRRSAVKGDVAQAFHDDRSASPGQIWPRSGRMLPNSRANTGRCWPRFFGEIYLVELVGRSLAGSLAASGMWSISGQLWSIPLADAAPGQISRGPDLAI